MLVQLAKYKNKFSRGPSRAVRRRQKRNIIHTALGKTFKTLAQGALVEQKGKAFQQARRAEGGLGAPARASSSEPEPRHQQCAGHLKPVGLTDRIDRSHRPIASTDRIDR